MQSHQQGTGVDSTSSFRRTLNGQNCQGWTKLVELEVRTKATRTNNQWNEVFDFSKTPSFYALHPSLPVEVEFAKRKICSIAAHLGIEISLGALCNIHRLAAEVP